MMFERELFDYHNICICGVTDTFLARATELRCRWEDNRIAWDVVGNVPGFTRDELIDIYREAWAAWAQHVNIRPFYSPGLRGPGVYHGSGYIDGPGKTLAWSEMPPCGIDRALRQKYDTGDHWVLSERPPQGKIDFLRVAIHEIGHAIGIPHIEEGNVMAAMYSVAVRYPQAGDIAAAVSLYGEAVDPPTPPPPVPPPPKPPKPPEPEEPKPWWVRFLEWLVRIIGG